MGDTLSSARDSRGPVRADRRRSPGLRGRLVRAQCEGRGLARHAEGRGAVMWLEGKTDFPQVGINLFVLEPGEPMSMYHWEADQEDFLVLSGEALLLIEGEERPLRQWDFVHC